MSRIFLKGVGGGEAQVCHSLEDLGSQTGFPKGVKENRKFQRGGGVNDFGFQRACGGKSILKFLKTRWS